MSWLDESTEKATTETNRGNNKKLHIIIQLINLFENDSSFNPRCLNRVARQLADFQKKKLLYCTFNVFIIR